MATNPKPLLSGTYTPLLNLYKPAVGEVGWGTLVDGNFDTLDGAVINGTDFLDVEDSHGNGMSINTGSDKVSVTGQGEAQITGNGAILDLGGNAGAGAFALVGATGASVSSDAAGQNLFFQSTGGTIDGTSCNQFLVSNLVSKAAVSLTMTQTAADNFARPDENPMSNGGKWVSALIGNAGKLVSSLYEATVVNTAGAAAWTGNGASFDSADQYSEVVIAAATATGIQVGPLVRASTAANTQYRLAISGPLGATATWTLFRVNAGVATQLGTATKTFAVADRVRLAVVGQTLYCFLNGVQFFHYTDYAPITSGVPGMIAFESSGAITNAQLSSWNAGTAVASAATSGNVTLQNSTAAISSASSYSPLLTFTGNYWNGSASAADMWTVQDVIGDGTNGASTLTFFHSGSSGTATVAVAQSNFALNNSIPSTSSTPQSSPTISLSGTYWTGSLSAVDSWTIQDVVASGTNGASTLTIGHSGSTGIATVSLGSAFLNWSGNGPTSPGNVAAGIARQSGLSNGALAIYSATGSAAMLLLVNGGTNTYNFTTTGVSIFAAEATAGKGLAYFRGATSQKAETGADANVLTVTPAAAVGTYRVTISIAVSAASAATLGWTMTYTDSNGIAQAPTNCALNKIGTAAPALTFTAAANDNYFATQVIDINNAGTAIVVKTTFSGTSIAYKITATIERLN